MNDKELKTISENIDSLHNKILNSKFAETVTESEVKSLILAVQFLNRQNEEIERLKIENQSLRSAANSYKLHYNEARAEAIKEFVERLKKVWFDNGYESPDVDFEDFVDNLVKKMVGETE